jgi:putative oxidoreductase
VGLVARLRNLHDRIFNGIEAFAGNWLPGLAARFVFAAVLFLYFFNSWATKVGSGFPGIFVVGDNAYYQIVPWAVEAAAGDVAQVGLIDRLIVHAGTYAELILPILIVLGLFSRLAALGMIGFVLVQSLVDIIFHKVGPETTGALFDRFSDSVIADQRLLWLFVLAMIVVKGGGGLSLDQLLARRRA